MSKQENIFLRNKKTILQIARANQVDTSVAANIAVQMANEVLAGKAVTYSTEGVGNFSTWVKDVEDLTAAELGHQMAEYNRAATEAIRRGEPWVL